MRYRYILLPYLLVAAMWSSGSAEAKPRARRFITDRPHRAVALGGSITAHPANFGKFLQHGCANLELVNYGKARLKASHLLRRLQQDVLADKGLMAQLQGKKPWLIYLGGLNGIHLPKRTRRNIVKTFELAHARGFRIAALTLPPWGSNRDRRFRAYEGLFKYKATGLVNELIVAKPGAGWSQAQLPDLAIDIYNSALRDRRARLRPLSAMHAAFATGRYKHRRRERRELARQARHVPRMFMRKRYRGRYHFHPNWRGHRLIATLFCKQAPAQWGCDCPKIAKAWPKRGRIYPRPHSPRRASAR